MSQWLKNMATHVITRSERKRVMELGEQDPLTPRTSTRENLELVNDSVSVPIGQIHAEYVLRTTATRLDESTTLVPQGQEEGMQANRGPSSPEGEDPGERSQAFVARSWDDEERGEEDGSLQEQEVSHHSPFTPFTHEGQYGLVGSQPHSWYGTTQPSQGYPSTFQPRTQLLEGEYTPTRIQSTQGEENAFWRSPNMLWNTTVNSLDSNTGRQIRDIPDPQESF